MRKKFVFILVSIFLFGLGFSNPNFPSFESFVLQGMGADASQAQNYKTVFSHVEIEKITTRDNYGLFSIYELSPSFIASMEVPTGLFNYDISALRVRFLAVGGSFYSLPGTEDSLKFIGAYLELCRAGAVDCRFFIRKYGL